MIVWNGIINSCLPLINGTFKTNLVLLIPFLTLFQPIYFLLNCNLAHACYLVILDLPKNS
jgi:hypothetical protein